MREKRKVNPKITAERFAEALKGTYGNLTAVAQRLHVSRTTVYVFLENNEDARV